MPARADLSQDVGPLGENARVTAQSAPEYDPDDPVEILRVLPARFHEQFLAEYDAAVTGARRPEHYHELHHLLRLWRLLILQLHLTHSRRHWSPLILPRLNLLNLS